MTLLQKIWQDCKKERENSERLATALEDLRNCIIADDLMPESVSYMRQAQVALIHHKVRQSARFEKLKKALKFLIQEEFAADNSTHWMPLSDAPEGEK